MTPTLQAPTSPRTFPLPVLHASNMSKLLLPWLLAPALALGGPDDPPPAEPGQEPAWVFPCEGYLRGLQGKGNFGVHVTSRRSPFRGSWHLAEDVWLRAGTEVRAVADGVVRYSAFSPTWKDERGHVYWNLGNVIVIEHALDPPLLLEGEEEPLAALCSVYVHLAADRRVEVGERVSCGQPLGRIGADRSEENGRYPAHLHFGLHRGPYVQIPPALARELRAAAASETGLAFGGTVLRGALELRLVAESVRITAVGSGESVLLSLLTGSTAPKDPPPDIASWCQGYGDEATVEEWLPPSTFLRARAGG